MLLFTSVSIFPVVFITLPICWINRLVQDQKSVGLNPVTGILNGTGVKATQVWLIHPAGTFLNASNAWLTNS